MPRLYADGFREVLTAAIASSTGTTVALPAGTGAKLAALSLSVANYLAVTVSNGTDVETMWVTGRATDDLTVLRAQEETGATPGSVGYTFPIGSVIIAPLTARGMRDLFDITAPELLAEQTADMTATANRLGIQARLEAGRVQIETQAPNGRRTQFQSRLARRSYKAWTPAGNSTTITAIGAPALTATGTATAANVATTNRHTRMKGLEYLVTVAATTAVAGWREAAAQHTVGGAASDEGGFDTVCQWGPATGVGTTTNRAFVGMSASTAAPTDVEPSTIANQIGMGWDAADTNIQIIRRDGTTLVKIDLGASFPVPTADRTKVYEIRLFSPPGSTQSVSYVVTDLGTGAVASGTITTNLPTNTTLLAHRGWMSVGGTSSVIGIALKNLDIESDY